MKVRSYTINKLIFFSCIVFVNELETKRQDEKSGKKETFKA
jgi:hypothetical protein